MQSTQMGFALPAPLPYLLPHPASSDHLFSNQGVIEETGLCFLLALLEASLPAKGPMLVLSLPFNQGLPHGATWRCWGPPLTKGVSSSNSDGTLNKSFCPQIKSHILQLALSVTKMTLDLSLSVSWILIVNGFWTWKKNGWSLKGEVSDKKQSLIRI